MDASETQTQTQTQTQRDAGRIVAWALAVAGGIIALGGCLLPWIVLDFGRIAILVRSPTRSLSANAWSLDGLGKMALICSIVLLIAAILVAAGSAQGMRRGLGVVIVVTGAIIGLVALFEMARKGSYVDRLLRDSFSSRLHRAISDPEFSRLKVLLDKLGFSVSFGVGLYLAVIGGILGVIGGALSLTGSKRAEPVAAGFASFNDTGPGPAVMPPPPQAAGPETVEADASEPVSVPVRADDPAAISAPVEVEDPAPVPTPPPLPMPPDVPPPPIPPDAPPLPAPPDVPPVPPISAEPTGHGSADDRPPPSGP